MAPPSLQHPTFQSDLDDPQSLNRLSSCIVGTHWSRFIGNLIISNHVLTEEEIRVIISTKFPERFDMESSRYDPVGWQSQVGRLLRYYTHFVCSEGLWSVDQALLERTTHKPGTHGSLQIKPREGWPPQEPGNGSAFTQFYAEEHLPPGWAYTG